MVSHGGNVMDIEEATRFHFGRAVSEIVVRE